MYLAKGCRVCFGDWQGMSTGDDRETGLSVFSGNAIYVGGYKSDGRTLHLIHGHPLTGAEEVGAWCST